MNDVYVAFGSNIGDSLNVIEKAKEEIQNNEMDIIGCSRIYITKPYGYTDQPDFVNGMLHIRTSHSCQKVLKILLDIEHKLGRVRTIHWGPRTIDLDIIFFNNEVYREDNLIVPHPDMQNRDFVLKPMCDLNDEYIHPVFGVSVRELLERL